MIIRGAEPHLGFLALCPTAAPPGCVGMVVVWGGGAKNQDYKLLSSQWYCVLTVRQHLGTHKASSSVSSLDVPNSPGKLESPPFLR